MRDRGGSHVALGIAACDAWDVPGIVPATDSGDRAVSGARPHYDESCYSDTAAEVARRASIRLRLRPRRAPSNGNAHGHG